MATTIHHAIVKKAARFGCTIEETAPLRFYLVRTIETKDMPADNWRAGPFDTAREAAAAADHPDTEFLDPEDALDLLESAARKCGVMDRYKHDEYEHNPHGPGCGDNVDIALRDAYTREKTGLDRDGIRECAGQLWDAKYETLNNGMVRMNVSNKIRGFLRNHQDAQWTIGQHTGRFGVSYNPAKRKAKKAA